MALFDTYTVSTGKSSVTYTRVRAPFKNLERFYFKIYRKGFFANHFPSNVDELYFTVAGVIVVIQNILYQKSLKLH